jgi:predicted PurR-regulated permease PerM
MSEAPPPSNTTVPLASAPVTPPARASVVSRALPIYVALVGAILTWIGIGLLERLMHVLILIFISALLAAAMTAPVDFLERLRIPRLISATLIQLAVVAVFVVAGWLLLPPLFDQGARFVDSVPERIQDAEGLQQRYDELSREYPQLESLDEQVSGFGERVLGTVGDQLVGLPQRLAQLMLDLLAISVISALLVANRPRLQRFGLSLLQPRHREHAGHVLDEMWRRLGHYVRAKLIVMAIIGTITFVPLWLLGVDYPLLLAGIVALGEAIPQVGPWIARVPLFGIAALESWQTLVAVIVLSLIVENLKGYLISPAVEGDQLSIDPLVVILSVLAGGLLLGPIGAFIAVPFAACVQVVCEEVLIPWRRGQIDEPGEAGGSAAAAPG